MVMGSKDHACLELDSTEQGPQDIVRDLAMVHKIIVIFISLTNIIILYQQYNSCMVLTFCCNNRMC